MRNEQCSICHEAIEADEAAAKAEHMAAGVAYEPQPILEALYYKLDVHDVDAHQFNG